MRYIFTIIFILIATAACGATAANRFMMTASSWSPAVLFSDGSPGVWLDPSDITTMFQDSAGTTPVTAVGQPVGKILDKSGRGNHAVQATAGNRPVLQQDSFGRLYLAFDGVNDGLGISGMTMTTSMDFFEGIYRDADDGQVLLAWGDVNTKIFGTCDSTGGNTYNLSGSPTNYVDGLLITNTRTALNTALTTAIKHVAEIRNLDLSAWGGVMRIGDYNTFQLKGRVYGIVLHNALSTSARTLLRTYMAAQSGATL